MEKTKKTKGSTLLLAIVVVSTVLFAGIGVSTIISRQTREMANIANEATAFYIAESVADMMNKDGLQETDCSVIDFGGKDVECDAEETEGGHLVIVRVGNDYYRFFKELGGSAGEGSGEEEVPEGVLRVYYHLGPWGSWGAWQSPLINARYLPSGIGLLGGNVPMNDAALVLANGWYRIDFNVNGEEGVGLFFQDSTGDTSTRDYGNSNIWYHFVPANKKIAYIRHNPRLHSTHTDNNIDLADHGKPMTIYYKPDESWGVPMISFRWDTTPTKLVTKLVPMHDASEEKGEGWYVFHHSNDKQNQLLFFFSKDETSGSRDYGNYKDWYYCLEREKTVQIDQNTNKNNFMCN